MATETKTDTAQTRGQGAQQEQQGLQGSQPASRAGGSSERPQSKTQQGGAVQQAGQGAVARYGSNPFGVIQELSQQMDQLFESVFFGAPLRRRMQQSQAPALWMPEVEVNQDENQLRVRVDLPGIPRDNVKVDIQEGLLVVQGERREERSEGGEDGGMRRTERRYGSFYRAIHLPNTVDTEHAEARMKDGVLEVIFPMSAQAQRRQLEIQQQ